MSTAFEYVVVGAGFYGLAMANQISEHLGKPVLVIEKRNHIGGNAFSHIDDDTGIEVHDYGSHLFHTSNENVWKWLHKFTNFTDYRHTVWTKHEGNIFSLPFNLNTFSSFFGRHFSPDQAKVFLSDQIHSTKMAPQNLEEKALQLVGQSLYEAFIKGYTWKQWQTDPKLLPPDVIARIPVRYNFDNRYFTDKYEGLPTRGYFELFNKIVSSSKIEIWLDVDFFSVKEQFSAETKFIYSGPLDRYFNYKYGPLTWRTLDFQMEVINVDDYQGASVINYADLDVPFTRIHEFKHLHPERNHRNGNTIIAREFSRFAEGTDEPYYPVNGSQDREKLKLYRRDASKVSNTIFGGRLGSYQYLDMHMAIASAFTDFKVLING